MARSTRIYLVVETGEGADIAGVFTVKHECASWCRRVFGAGGQLHDRADQFVILRMQDNGPYEPEKRTFFAHVDEVLEVWP